MQALPLYVLGNDFRVRAHLIYFTVRIHATLPWEGAGLRMSTGANIGQSRVQEARDIQHNLKPSTIINAWRACACELR